MIETKVVLRTPVPLNLAAELERRIFFVSAHIASFELVKNGAVVDAVRLFSETMPDQAGLAAKLNSLVESDVTGQPELPSTVVWKSADHTVTGRDVYASLLTAGLVSECGQGQVALAEPLVSLMDGMDRSIRRIVVEGFGATEYRYPTLIPTAVLDSASYPASFPQFLMVATRLHEDLDVYRDFQSAYVKSGKVDKTFLDRCTDVDYCLPPTMCYHTFGQYRGRVLEPDRVHVVTSRGKSFRHESRYATTLERLWDFTIRETVFFGDRTGVLDAREKLMTSVFALMDEWQLEGFCTVASDPFFIGADPGAKAWSQRMLELKYELRLGMGPDKDVAVGSFNFHDDFFGKSFDIGLAGAGSVVSGCAGFGLERLVYALLCQHGPSFDDWPRSVRELCADVPGRRPSHPR
jgi:seryl-tRNA synthetase